MDMESTAEFSSDHSAPPVFTKRKRSKRQRRSSPFCATVVGDAAITSSYSSGGVGAGSGSNCFPTDQYSPNPSISTDLSPEEEEELVSCLMLLARGICPKDELSKAGHRITEKFSSPRFVESDTSTDISAAADDGKSGYVVYECKTCNRTFPSFQALGGHCASHKKMKLMPGENTERSLALLPPLINSDEEGEARIDTKNILSPLPLQMISGKGKAKMHECSICHTDFTSGQALGGHMRRHRTAIIKPPLPSATNPPSSSTPSSQFIPIINATKVDVVENRSSRLLLDLNLPAAPEDDDRDFNSALESTSRGIVCLPIFE